MKSTTVVPVTPVPARGAVLSLAHVTTITKASMQRGLAGEAIAQLGGPPQCDVELYAIRYATVGVHDEPADADTAFFVPGRGCAASHVLVAYAQGTNVVRAQTIVRPTNQNIEPTIVAAIFAAHGYPVAATDYLGLGTSSYPYQPYLVVDTEATAIVDSIRAVRNAARTLGIRLSDALYITGHSQGGQAALGTQRAIEAHYAAEFRIVADAPSSGPYDLTRTTIDGVLHPGQNAPILAAYVLTAYQHAYGNAYSSPQAAFQEPYAGWIENLLPVTTYAQAGMLLGKTIPLHVRRLIQPAFARQFTSDPSTGARVDVAANDLVRGWKPKAPLYLCGGDRDPQVEYVNSRIAYRFFKAEGANVGLTDVNGLMPPQVGINLYHDAVLVLCLTVERVAVLDGQFKGRR
ncbi:MAG: hypothetical protein JO199_11620 [Candidatus Eremiobacteraeota bacterium]|nr:hypothetical protein [Candidatus Eremiobacteraeota bacterium]